VTSSERRRQQEVRGQDVAKAKAATPKSRGPSIPPKPERGSNYLKEVYLELRKVSWPTRTELIRMTQVVIATVVLFAVIIGAADLVFSILVKQLYTQSGSTTIGNFK
jgi:preprotein translocase subunit SecE